MMKTLRISCSILIGTVYSFCAFTGYAQNIAINTTGASADPSALLDVKSTTAGLLIPRMNTSQRNAISSPAIGLQIFNTDCSELNYWNGVCWLSTGSPLPAPDSIACGGSTALCAGTTTTYTVAAVTGAATYYWSVPPAARITSGQGTTSITVTYGSYSGNVCVVAYDACESSGSTCRAIQVNASPVSVSITANPSGTVSPGTNVTFSAIPVNGGPTPTYQWMNGSTPVGTNSPTYTNTFTNGNVITCILTTSNTACVTGSPATSNAITMSVTSPVTLNISTSTYNGRQVFAYSGGNQTFNIPSYVTQIFVKMWGAGGGGGYNSTGGSGAFVSGYQSNLTPGSTLTVVVGGAGIYTAITTTSSPGGFGGGGASGSGTSTYTGSGGGRSAIQIVAGKDTVTAGAGGGGGSYRNNYPYGGGGGATTGGNGEYSYSSYQSGYGNGGTTTAGGAASSSGSPNSLAASSIRYTYSGSAGGGGTTWGGGGGGGGFFGGSGGAGSSNGEYCGGGGGGSSYLGGLASSVNGTGNVGSTSQVPVINPTDVDYITGVGVGGAANANGGNGLVVIYW